MSQSEGPWIGRFIWHDLMTKDARRAQDFYTHLFDWQVMESKSPAFPYRMILAGPGPIGGIVEEKEIPAAHWMPYCAVPDVDRATARWTELGGSVCVPPTDIPSTGRFAVVGDPQGAYLSLFTGQPGSQGFDPDLPVPGRVCWNELLTADPEAAQRFYGAMFGWTSEEKDMGPYGTYRIQIHGGKQAGGIMRKPDPEIPDAWLVYFLATDLEASTARAKALGATAMMELEPIEGIGSFSLMTDPTGAVFSLFQPVG